LLIYKIDDQYWGICCIVEAFSRVVKAAFEGIVSRGKGVRVGVNGVEGRVDLKKKKRKITLAVKAACKRIRMVVEAGFLQWKQVSLMGEDVVGLKIETLREVFCGIQKKMKRMIFNVYGGVRYKKHLKKPVKSRSFAGGVKIMSRYLISFKRTIFYQLIHTRPNPSSSSSSIKKTQLPRSLYFLYTQLLHKLRFSFRTWSRHSLNSVLNRSLSLKSLCNIHKHLLNHHFHHWKHLPNN